jgi:hypothetical protein
MVIVNFIRDKEVGLFARVKRLSKEGKIKGKTAEGTDNAYE